jgi:hypothetical protein
VAVKANADAIERMIRDVAKNYGYAREDLVSDRLRWTELTPAEWHDADEQVIAELKGVGLQPREKEYFRKDGRACRFWSPARFSSGNLTKGSPLSSTLTDRKWAVSIS